MKFCTKCGAPIDENTKFCKKCGNPVKNNVDAKEKQFTEASDKIDINDSGEKNKRPTINLSKGESDKKSNLKEEPKVQDLSETQKIPVQRLNEQSNYNQPNYNNVTYPKKPEKKFLSGIVPKLIAGLLVIVVILIGVFFNRIEAAYYISKCNNSIDGTEKFEYATKAVKALDSSNTKNLLKNTLVEIAKDDVDLAEKDLEKVSNMISQGDYQNIASGIKEKKVDKLCSQGKYQEAFNELNEINKLGGDFKSNKNYDDIMLNVVAKVTSTSVQNTKSLLMDNNSICFDNFDGDAFDEIIELKKNGSYSYSYSSDIKLNLYKCKNGQYKLVDTKIINSAWNGKMQGVYNYDTDKKGVYVSYSTSANSGNTVGTSVYGVSDDKLQLKGTVCANNYTKPEDVNNDGIYEILSNSSSLVSQSAVSKWYRVYDDGKAPTEVNGNGGQTSKTSASSNDYIFKDSDKTYLMEDDLRGKTKDELALARNEIFARHGYVFTDETYKKYFSSKSWYTPNSSYDGSDSGLNQYEIANYKVIQNWENK